MAGLNFPPLTTISHQVAEVGRRAVELAITIMDEGIQYPYGKTFSVPSKLVIRKGTGPATPSPE